jgi:hypothetical protein
MPRSRELAELATSYDSGGSLGFRNRIINGDMRIDQRNAGASVTPTTSSYTLDRWFAVANVSSKFSVQQNAGSVTPPAGFTNYLGITSLAATSLGASDYYLISQKIEGYNIADFGWGTAGAQTVTLSFWVRSSLTGTFGGVFTNSAQNRSYPFTYTISAANTWEQKSVTVAGDTSGTWLTTNGTGLWLLFGLGVGSTFNGTAGSWSGSTFLSATGATSVVGTNGATFYITGVQLEAGSVATPFERRDYGRELMMCQRYCIVYGGTSGYERFGSGPAAATTYSFASLALPVQMRASQSISFSSASHFAVGDGVSNTTITNLIIGSTSTKVLNLTCEVASGLTATRYYDLFANNTTSARLTVSAEL